MKEGSQAPEFQEEVGCPVFLFFLKAVETSEDPAECFTGLIDGQAQGKDIDRMGIMVPVLHEKGAAVGLVFAEQLDHLFGLSVLPQKDIQEAVIDHVGIHVRSRIDKGLQGLFQTEAVQISLHVKGDLILFKTGSQIFPCLFFLLFLCRVETKAFAPGPDKAKGSGFQVAALFPVHIHGRLERPNILPEPFSVYPAHLFQSCICHHGPPFSIFRNVSITNMIISSHNKNIDLPAPFRGGWPMFK